LFLIQLGISDDASAVGIDRVTIMQSAIIGSIIFTNMEHDTEK